MDTEVSFKVRFLSGPLCSSIVDAIQRETQRPVVSLTDDRISQSFDVIRTALATSSVEARKLANQFSPFMFLIEIDEKQHAAALVSPDNDGMHQHCCRINAFNEGCVDNENLKRYAEEIQYFRELAQRVEDVCFDTVAVHVYSVDCSKLKVSG